MAKFITRTIVSTTIIVGELEGTEVKPVAQIVEEGKLDQEKAIKIVQKAFKGRNVLVLNLKHDEGQYKMSTEDFIANAEKVEASEEVVEEVQETEVA
ncbi:hypothetical protein DLn1_00018 [Bacillus phage DLn1]|nr:hypothetical protein DLn1_00018 [Bacillus phage DLn1]